MKLLSLLLLTLTACTQEITLRVLDAHTIQVDGCWSGERVTAFTGIQPESLAIRGFEGAMAQDHIRHCLEWVLQSLQPCKGA